ncbi:MAG: protein-L-isoaspartate O-methyltransferase [Wenzhouxiangellaceae bacterium]|nr:protein-L-isoaspartate O-methyltransferase [Wenzhouxiangellaceae bacterium]
MNLEQARSNMIEQQVRTWDVLDGRVLDAMKEVPREEFVPARHRKLAFSDLRVPIGSDQVMMKPIEEGRLLQSLNLESGQSVLDVGTGSGFLAACLARLGGKVTSIEIHEDLADQAKSNLESTGVEGVDLRVGNVFEADFDGPFDVVVVTSSVPEVPDALKDLVAPGGRLFIVRGRAPAMEAVTLTRVGDEDRFRADSLFETDLPRLVGAEDAPRFEF